jgi:hypothetical protein
MGYLPNIHNGWGAMTVLFWNDFFVQNYTITLSLYVLFIIVRCVRGQCCAGGEVLDDLQVRS